VPSATNKKKKDKKKGTKKSILDLFTTDAVYENVDKIVNQFLGKNKCFSGDVALALTEKLVCENNKALKPLLRETEINVIEVFDDVLFVEDKKIDAVFFEQLLEIFPQSIVKKGIIYFQNYGDLLTANKTKFGWIVNTHYLAATYLFKFFMIGHSSFLDKYYNCMMLLKYGTNPKLPNTINGEYYGTANINLPWLFDSKRESCALLNIPYLDRPVFSQFFSAKGKKEEKDYETYKVRGLQTNKLINKTTECK
jgi:hypothetical protein